MRANALFSQGSNLEHRLILVAIFLFALLVRVVVIDATVGFSTPAAVEPAADSRIHIAIVQSLLEGKGYRFDGKRTAITPPLYIFFLAGLYRVFHSPEFIRLIQAVIGAVGCILLFEIGRRMLGYATGLVAALVLSVHPLAAYLAGLHLTESLFLFLVLLILYQSLRVAERPTTGATLLLGALVGFAALTRAVFLGFLPFVVVWTASVWGIRAPSTYRTFALVVVGTIAVLTPWTIRNYLALGAVVPVQSNGGVVFWAGNNPSADGGLVWPTHTTWTAGPPPDDGNYGWQGLSLTAANRRYVETAWAWIRQHPHEYERLLVRKLTRLVGFSRAMNEADVRVPKTVGVFQVAFLTAALLGFVLSTRRWRPLVLPFGLIAFTLVATLIFSGATRYTVPMVPSLCLLAAVPLTTRWFQPQPTRVPGSV